VWQQRGAILVRHLRGAATGGTCVSVARNAPYCDPYVTRLSLMERLLRDIAGNIDIFSNVSQPVVAQLSKRMGAGRFGKWRGMKVGRDRILRR
jgi:hypothetical protein